MESAVHFSALIVQDKRIQQPVHLWHNKRYKAKSVLNCCKVQTLHHLFCSWTSDIIGSSLKLILPQIQPNWTLISIKHLRTDKQVVLRSAILGSEGLHDSSPSIFHSRLHFTVPSCAASLQVQQLQDISFQHLKGLHPALTIIYRQLQHQTLSAVLLPIQLP